MWARAEACGRSCMGQGATHITAEGEGGDARQGPPGSTREVVAMPYPGHPAKGFTCLSGWLQYHEAHFTVALTQTGRS